MTKFIAGEEAAALVNSGATLAFSGFVGFGTPDYLLKCLRDRYDKAQAPQNLCLVKAIGDSDKKGRGTDRLAAGNLIGTLISSHAGLEPALSQKIYDNQCLAYMLPYGNLVKLFRAAAAHQPGILTKIGLGTFADPRLEGSKVNDLTKTSGKDMVRLVDVDGKEYLYYKAFPIDIAFVRGTYADEEGNISFEKEGVICDQLEIAAAAHNSGGIVIAEVEDIVAKGSLNPQLVKLHRFMIDYVVKAPAAYHRQSFASDDFRPELTGVIKKPLQTLQPLPLDNRKICAHRSALELKPGYLINLGIGIPQAAAAVAAELGFADTFILSTESGVLGGVPLPGLDMGAAINPEAMYKTADILDYYDGGCLDMAILGLAEIDGAGNVNVSKFNGHVAGPGGFIDISQNTPRLIFTGTFTAGGLKETCQDGKLIILQEGKYKKFKKNVEQITFSASYANQRGQQVLIVTERAVFQLTQAGLELIEIAPGIDLQQDILEQMEFLPTISPELKVMDASLFQ